MRSIRLLIAAGIVVLVPMASSFATTVDYRGLAWDSAPFPPTAPGDTLSILIVVSALSPELGFDSASEEVTGFISGLVSSGPQDGGDGVTYFTFSTGRIEIYRDPSRDHDFGVDPPNGTVPSTFTNGTLCLAGALTDFVLYLDGDSSSGAYEGNVDFTEGQCLGQLGAASAEGYTFGGVLTRQALGSIPSGYALAIDGFLEAQKKPLPACPFDCIRLTSANLDFPKRPPLHFKPTDGKFDIEGVFDACPSFGELDPSEHEVRLRIGDYEQIFPAGTLHREGSHGGDPKWKYENPHGTATITEVEIELEDEGSWEFDIEGRGITRQHLLGDGVLLQVELSIDDMNGSTQETLVQKRTRLRFHGHEGPCNRHHDDHGIAPKIAVAAAATSGLVPATPNPFNATTTILLRAAAAGPASLRIYDVRGQLVRELLQGTISAGEHRLVWNGADDGGRPVSSGIYLYRVVAPGIAESHKMVVAK